MIICDIFTVIFLAGGYIIQYFTRQKLGMLRWVNYHTYRYREALPLDILKYAAEAAIIFLALFAVFRLSKKRGRGKVLDKIMLIIMAVILLIYAGFTTFVSMETVQAYYFVMPLLGAAALVQVVKILIAAGKLGNEEK